MFMNGVKNEWAQWERKDTGVSGKVSVKTPKRLRWFSGS
jgi:hypothetical protein